ncbi:MAG TPA: HAMP domain-containing sensor histidine kinase [Gemmatimonadaceae bacterium]|nr:HAMP domain-containing sensor histidine kinase [Gemmatimonadaceae bacterium]
MPRATPLTIRFLERLPFFASVTAVLIAAVALTGWWLDITVLTRIVPWAAPMLPQTAVATALAGIALALACMEQRWARVLAISVASIVTLMSTFTFGAHDLPGGDVIERLFFAGGHAPDHLQIPVNTALALLLLGISIAMLALPRFRERRATQLFAAGALLVAFVAFVGYSFGVGGLYQPTSALGMSAWSVIAIHALALGVIFARTRVGFPELLIDRGPGGRLARRLLPAAIVIPFIVAWIVAQGERANYFDAYLASSIATVLTVIALVWISARGARVVQRTDKERAQVFAREQHEREVAQQALIAAETASSAKSDFLAVMSHELRTPLTAIIGYEELLADEVTGPVSAQQAQQLSRIKASAQHLLGLIDEILTFSRLEAGRETIRLEIVDVNRILEEAASLISPLAGEKKLGFAVYPLDPPRQMRTDSGKLRQILVNLLSNAVKFTSQGGITVTSAVDAGELEVGVADTGVGIAEEHLDRIFEPFWQVEQKATRRVGGTGLGLTVTRRLARLLGGDVTVESAVGEGTVFTATIPGVIPLAAAVPEEAAEPSRTAARA